MKTRSRFGYIKSGVILFVIAIILGLPGIAVAADSGTTNMGVMASTQMVDVGSQFDVNITVQPGTNIAGAQFSLSFNPDLVTINGISEGNLLKQGSADTYFNPGRIDNNAGAILAVSGAITTPGQTVSAEGTLAIISMTAINPGDCALTLSNVVAGNINGQAQTVSADNGQITINQPQLIAELDHIIINPANISIGTGDTQAFSAQGYDSNNNPIDDVVFNWSVNDLRAGSISSDGLFTAGIGAGSYPNVIQADKDGVVGMASVTVKAGALDHIIINPADISTQAGDTQAFSAQGYDSNNNVISGLTYTWKITNSSAGSINSSGLFTAGTMAGSYTNVIQVVSGTVTGKASVTIKTGVLDHITVNPATISIGSGVTQAFSAQGYDSNNNVISGLTYTWRVTNTKAGAISARGLFKAGTTAGSYANVIQAAAGGKTGTASVNVIQTDFELTTSIANRTISAGSTTTYPVTVAQLNGFKGSVALKVSGFPAGITGTFSPSSTQKTSALTIKTTSSARLGTYILTITGTSGKIVKTTNVTLVVVSPPGFTLNVLSVNTLNTSLVSNTITRGSQAKYNITVVPTGNFTSNVNLSISGLPARAGATFSSKTTKDSAVLTINTSSLTAKGTYKLTITGVGGGKTSKSVLTLIVK